MPELIDFANPPMLAEGVGGYTVDNEGELWIPVINAVDEGSGHVGIFLDSLPTDRRVVFACVISKRLKGMLERRGFIAGSEVVEADGYRDVVEVMARCAGGK